MALNSVRQMLEVGLLGPLQKSRESGLNTQRELALGQKDLLGANRIFAEQLNSQIRGVSAAIENSDQARSLIRTAEEALEGSSQLIGRLETLTLKAAQTATQDEDAANALRGEISSTLQSLDRIARNTSFGSKNLFDGSRAAATREVQGSELTDLNIDRAPSGGQPVRVDVEVVNAATAASTRFSIGSGAGLDTTQRLRISGSQGSANIDLQAGSTGSDIAEAINLQSDRSGVSANFDATTREVVLSSRDVGSSATVNVEDIDGQQDLLKFTGSSEFFDPNDNVSAKLSSTNASLQSALEASTFGTTDPGAAGTVPSQKIKEVRSAADEVQSLALSIANSAAKKALAGGATTSAASDTTITTALEGSAELADAFADLETANAALVAEDPANPGIGAGATLDNLVTSLKAATTGVNDTDVATSYSFNTGARQASGTNATVRINGVTTNSSGLDVQFESGGARGNFRLQESSNREGFRTSFVVGASGEVFQFGSSSNPSGRFGLSLSALDSNSLGSGTIANPDFDAGKPESADNPRQIQASLASLSDGGSLDPFSGARSAGEVIARARSQLSGARADLGSIEQRLDSNRRSLDTSKQELTRSSSQLQDTDFAVATAELERNRQRQEAGIRTLAQANALTRAVFSLLG